MAAKIRLKKVGRRGQPSYRVVVLDGRKPRDAKVVADLGHYDPKTNPATFEIDGDAALKWLLEGAKATRAARDILSKAGVMAAWDAAKCGKTVAIEAKELKPTTKPKKAKAQADDGTSGAEERAEAEVPVADETPAEVEEAPAETVEESAEVTQEPEQAPETGEPEPKEADEPEVEADASEAETDEPEAAAADEEVSEDEADDTAEEKSAAQDETNTEDAREEEGESGEEDEEEKA
jgi:small subunit ribosomal protein S16